MQENMVSDLSRDRIKRLIERSKLAKPYTKDDEEYDCLDAEYDGLRGAATSAKTLLDRYFEQHPEDKIENYID